MLGPAHDDPILDVITTTEELSSLAAAPVGPPGGLMLLHQRPPQHSLALAAAADDVYRHQPLENNGHITDDLKGIILESLGNISSSIHVMGFPPDPDPASYGNMLGSNGLNTALLASTTSTTYNQSYNSSAHGEVPEFPIYIRIWATCVMGALLMVGVAGNALVPLLVFRNRELRHSTNLFLINLALADTLLLLICLPTTIVELHSQPETWAMGPFLCRLVHFVEWSVARASVLTLLVISVERYVAICKPLSSTTLCTRPRAALTSALIWPIATCASMPTLLATAYYETDYHDGSRVNVCITRLDLPWAHNYFLASLALFFCTPFIFLLMLYGLIARRLLDHRTRNRRRLDSPAWKQRKQVVKMLVTVVLVFFVCLLPFRLLALWLILSPKEYAQNLGVQTYYNILYTCRALSYLNSAINPIIYNAMSSKFRRAFVRLTGLSYFSPRSRLLRRRSTLTTTVNYSSSTNSEGGSLRRAFSWRRYSDFSFRIHKLNEASSRRASEITLGGKRISFSRKGSKSSFLSKKSSSYSISTPTTPAKISSEGDSTQESQQDQADEEDRMLPRRHSKKDLAHENGKSAHKVLETKYSVEGKSFDEEKQSLDKDEGNKQDGAEEGGKKGKKLADGGKKVSFNDKVEHCDEEPKDNITNADPEDIQAFIAADNNRVTHL